MFSEAIGKSLAGLALSITLVILMGFWAIISPITHAAPPDGVIIHKEVIVPCAPSSEWEEIEAEEMEVLEAFWDDDYRHKKRDQLTM